MVTAQLKERFLLTKATGWAFFQGSLSLHHLPPTTSLKAPETNATKTKQLLTPHVLLPDSLSSLLCSIWTLVITAQLNEKHLEVKGPC